MALSVDELSALLADLDSDRVERKAGLFDKDMVGKIICAFANDLAGHAVPGVLFIGVSDDGSHGHHRQALAGPRVVSRPGQHSPAAVHDRAQGPAERQ